MSNTEILQRFLQIIWNEKDTPRVSEFVSAAYTIHLDAGDPWEGKTLSLEEYAARLQHSFVPFPDIHFAVESAVADGNCVAITWVMTGTNLGPIGNMAPTGKAIRTQGATIYYFDNGKVCGHSQVFDRGTVMRQLGFGR